MTQAVAIQNGKLIFEHGVPLNTLSQLHTLQKQFPQAELFFDKAFGITILQVPETAVLAPCYSLLPLRQWMASEGEQEAFAAFRANALCQWRQNTRFCGHCGTALVEHPDFTARSCPNCGNLIFPRINPCVIVAVYNKGKILLANHILRNQDVYTCLAGFVEAGESLEMAVKREIREEVGIEVDHICYKGSQSWPFPAQLMMAFTAEYVGGEIKPQADEIADAQWFDPEHLPSVPRPGSIAYRLIHHLF